MKKLSLLSLVVFSTAFPALGPVIRSAVRSRVPAGGMLAYDQNREQSMQRRTRADKVPLDTQEEAKKEEPKLSEFTQQLETEIGKNKIFWKQLQDSGCERLRIAALARLFGKDKADVVEAVKRRDHELVGYLLSCGADPNSHYHGRDDWGTPYFVSIIEMAIGRDDCTTFEILLKAGARVSYQSVVFDAYHRTKRHPSFSALKLLLEYGADVKNLTKTIGRSGWSWVPVSPVYELVQCAGFLIDGYNRRRQELTDNQYIDLLKKAMLLTRAGDPLAGFTGDFSNYPDGDWTKGKFPDLAKYIEAVVTTRKENASVTKKTNAERTMRTIMKKYGITKEDLEITPKAPAASSRVDESN